MAHIYTFSLIITNNIQYVDRQTYRQRVNPTYLQTLQQQKMAEAQRLQQADVAGEQFMFSTREGREMQQLDRTASMLGAAKQAEAQADSDRTGAITGAIGSLTGMAGAYYGSQPTG